MGQGQSAGCAVAANTPREWPKGGTIGRWLAGAPVRGARAIAEQGGRLPISPRLSGRACWLLPCSWSSTACTRPSWPRRVTLFSTPISAPRPVLTRMPRSASSTSTTPPWPSSASGPGRAPTWRAWCARSRWLALRRSPPTSSSPSRTAPPRMSTSSGRAISWRRPTTTPCSARRWPRRRRSPVISSSTSPIPCGLSRRRGSRSQAARRSTPYRRWKARSSPWPSSTTRPPAAASSVSSAAPMTASCAPRRSSAVSTISSCLRCRLKRFAWRRARAPSSSRARPAAARWAAAICRASSPSRWARSRFRRRRRAGCGCTTPQTIPGGSCRRGRS